MTQTRLERLMVAGGDAEATAALLRTLTPVTASELARLALLRLQCCVDAGREQRARDLVRALRALDGKATLPAGEPEATLRILASFGVHAGEAESSTRPDPAALLTKAAAAYASGDWDSARELVSFALVSPARLEADLRVRCVRILLDVHHNRGEFEQEVALLDQIRSLLAYVDPLLHSEILLHLGNAETEMRRYADAYRTYEAALRLVERLDPVPLLHKSNLKVNSTNAYHAQMDRSDPVEWRQVRSWYEDSYRWFLDCPPGDNSGGARADRLTNIAWTYAKEADVTEDSGRRQQLLRRSGLLARLAFWHNQRGPAEQPERRAAHILGTLCRAYEAQGRFDLAEDCHRRAVDLADAEPNRPDIRWDARWSYADFCVRRGSWADAARQARAAHRLVERERRQREHDEGRSGLSRANVRIYRALIEAEIGARGLEGARLDEVFRWMEVAKARCVLDAMVGGRPAGRHDGSIATPISYRRFTEGLPNGTWMVEYFELDRSIVALALTRGGGGLVALEGSPRDIMEETGAVVTADGVPMISARSLRQLARNMLEPVLDRVHGSLDRLVVVPHAALHRVPFHALVLADGYVIERTPVVYAPSASVFHKTARRAPSADVTSASFLAVGVSDARAPRAGEEILEISAARTLGGAGRTQTLVNEEATMDAVLERATSASSIHFACHAQAQADPMQSYLQLFDGPLTVAQILKMARLRGSNVTMHACSTGVEQVDAGEEHIGLPSAFLQAGAKAVVGSLWTTVDFSGPEFATRYHRGMDEGLPAAEALHRAQLSWLNGNDKRLRDPIWWAPYFLTGS